MPLIVLERDIGLRTFIESGVRLDSQISRDLLLSIFRPGTALHDGAVIRLIQKDRICGSGLLSAFERESRSGQQRLERGIARASVSPKKLTASALIVSEETGQISLAAFGELESGVTIERVDERINLHFGVAERTTTLAGRPIARSTSQAEPEDQPVESATRTRD